MAADTPRRRWARSVRARATQAACLVVSAFYLVAAAAFVVLLSNALTEAVDNSALALAEDVASEGEQELLSPALMFSDAVDTFVQVVDEDGTVVSTSTNLTGAGPVVDFPTAPDAHQVRQVDDIPLEGPGPYRVASMGVRLESGTATVYVGRTLHVVREEMVLVGVLLAVGLPLLVGLVGTTSWVLVGRSLQPVEGIRAEVADISSKDLHRRVPEPSSGDEVARLAVTMNAMLDRLEASTERQRRFVDDASHELRSPLAAIRGDLEVALSGPGDVDWRTVARDVLGDVERQERLVEDLLYLARADAPVATGWIAATPPGAIVDLDEVVLRESHGLRPGSVEIDVSGVSPAPVRGSREDLGRVARNLLDNALRHARSKVTVELAAAGSTVTLVVSDDGLGIAPPDRERVFERFTRLDDSRSRDGGGTGLGLAIAREVVAAHGGTIVVGDAPVGARLVVRLPGET